MPDTLIALRIGTPQWLKDDVFARLLGFLDQRPGAVDELAFFTAATHPPLPLDEIAQRCARLAEIMPYARKRGYRAGINVLASMGHHEENLPHSLDKPWPRVTDPEGRISRGSFCPASPALLGYVDQLYTLVAQAGPDFVWVDDDVRLLGHMPIVATCFCDACVARFNAETGAAFSRETLVAALRGSATPERDTWRARWLEHNRGVITQLLRTAAQAVHRVDPRIPLGFMTGDRFYEGYAFAEWADALEGPDAPARWRPGGGFYADDAYMGLVDKAHDIGRQVSQLPPKVTLIQSEIENFPYHRLRKSVAVTLLEAAAHMAAGATGPAFNILTMHPDPLDEYRPFLDGIAAARPFLQALRDAAGRSPALGIWPAWNRDVYGDYGVEGAWPERSQNVQALRAPYVLGELGLPIAYGRAGARLTAFSGSLPASFTPSELEQIFSGGVLLDGAALRTLERLGLAAWAGVRVADTIAHDAQEVLTDNPLNDPFVGWSRDARQSFWPQPAYRLEPTAPGVGVLAHLSDYADQDLGPCLSYYENALGGRVAVLGYYPWTLTHNLAKTSQLKALCRWLSRDTLPVLVESYARAVVWARAGADGDPVLILLNASLDPAPELTLRVQTTAPRLTRLGMDGTAELLRTTPAGPAHVRVTLRHVAPWSLHLLRCV